MGISAGRRQVHGQEGVGSRSCRLPLDTTSAGSSTFGRWSSRCMVDLIQAGLGTSPSPRGCYHRQAYEFIRCDADACLFDRVLDEGRIHLNLYVDDGSTWDSNCRRVRQVLLAARKEVHHHGRPRHILLRHGPHRPPQRRADAVLQDIHPQPVPTRTRSSTC